MCANCHLLGGQGEAIGPNLAGIQRNDPGRLIANIVNPSTVVARQYQVTMIRTSDGRVLAGLLQDETPQAVTLQTANELVTLSKHDIESRSLLSESFMPTGLLVTLKEHEVLDLVSYLMSANLTDVSLQSYSNRQQP